MAVLSNPPPVRAPLAFQRDPEVRGFFDALLKSTFLIWQRVGGGTDTLTFLGGQPNVITTRGDVIRGSSTGAAARYALGVADTVLSSNGTDAAWAAKGQPDVITTRGDIVRGSAVGAAERLAIGAAGTVVSSDGTDAAWGFEGLVQSVNTASSAVATGTTKIPEDDTIPTNTEGDQVLSATITPKASAHTLDITASLFAASSFGGVTLLTASLFKDAGAAAIAATTHVISGPDLPIGLTLRHQIAAGSTSAQTFKIRIGTDADGTTTINGRNGARMFGGVASSSITVLEIAP